ncbi:agrA protein [Pediococcus claussenii]|nr:agrA protein [Pediococcus claussenii]
MINDFDMAVVSESTDSAKVTEYLRNNEVVNGVYFLDIQLDQSVKNGLESAVIIRELDPMAKIIFISTHSEMAILTFERKVEPLDFIMKDIGVNKVKTRIEEDIRVCYTRYLKTLNKTDVRFKYRIGSTERSINIKDVYYIESSSRAHKVVLHAKKRIEEYYDNIADIEQQYSTLFRCHRSFLINVDNVSSYDTKLKKIRFVDGETCPIAARKVRKFCKVIQN